MSEPRPEPSPYRLAPAVARRVRATVAHSPGARSRRRTALIVAVARAERSDGTAPRPRPGRDPQLN